MDGWQAFWITVGVFSPIVIFIVALTIIRAIIVAINEVADNRKYNRFMNPKYWHLQKVLQAPNPDFIWFEYMNNESRQTIRLGVEKKEIRGVMS